MDIYKMNDKDLRKMFGEFSSTNFGKIVGILSFSVPAVFFLLTIIATVLFYMEILTKAMAIIAPVFALLTLVMFVNGNRYFYSELRKFIEYKKESK